jgi:hypothetical protein
VLFPERLEKRRGKLLGVLSDARKKGRFKSSLQK